MLNMKNCLPFIAFRKSRVAFHSIVFGMMLVLFAGAAGAETFISGFEMGVSGRFDFALGEISKHEFGNVGVSLEYAWPLPLGLPESLLSDIGLCAEAGVLFPVGMASYIDSWWVCDFGLGAYVDLKINPRVIVRPELLADFRLNFIESNFRNLHGPMLDVGVKTGAVLVLDFSESRLLFKAGADYVILPEKNNICHYFAVKTGAAFRFN